MSKARLYMVPSLLGDGDPKQVLGEQFIQTLKSIRYFIVENEKNARRFLVGCGMREMLNDLEFGILNEHTSPKDYGYILEPLFDGKDTGILSDAGCPGIADPGAELVAIAHRNLIEVIPLIGPSSITMALMASGLNGQKFSFQGYLPVKSDQRSRQILELEKRSKREGETQVFIEAPYRNIQLLQELIRVLKPDTQLCVACNLTQPDQYVQTRQIREWNGRLPEIQKRPTVFLFLT